MQNYVCENLKVCIRILYADQAKNIRIHVRYDRIVDTVFCASCFFSGITMYFLKK